MIKTDMYILQQSNFHGRKKERQTDNEKIQHSIPEISKAM